LSGCLSPSQIATAKSAIAKVSTDAATLSADEPKAVAAVTALTGSTATVANAASYVSTIATDAQTLAPLLSSALSLFTSVDSRGHRTWNAAGIAALHRYHIDPRDRYAALKLSRFYALSQDIKTPKHKGLPVADQIQSWRSPARTVNGLYVSGSPASSLTAQPENQNTAGDCVIWPYEIPAYGAIRQVNQGHLTAQSGE
jgi:hypothetical protein